MLTLSKAIKDGKLQDFIAQEEARGVGGVGPINSTEFDETAVKLIRTEQSDDQTFGSPRRDGSRGR